MKPLLLSIKGLHSYREEQTIDFEQLTAGGVFGIFGPTGSGKSTILDAITLALYGKVERAANNTQGIIHHGEKEAKVSFVFELNRGGKKERFRVERSFRKTDGQGVRTATCRLLDVTDGSKILADKAQEVNQRVVQLLGLSSEDFTRAVVLPQGKFAEFLTLKGTERRQMLERLFNLERYGEQLRQTLSLRLQETKAELQQVRAEQAGLGDASEAALKAAREKVEACQKRLTQAQATVQKLEEEVALKEEIWKDQEELKQLSSQWEKLEERKAEMETLARRLQRADEAKVLFPYVEALENAQKEALRWKGACEQGERELQWVQEAFQQAQKAYDQAQERRRREEPRLSVKLEQLREAQSLQGQIDEWSKEKERLQAELAEKEQALAIKRQELKKEEDLKKKGEERQKEIREKLEQLKVDAQYKALVYEADQQLRDLKHLWQRAEQLKGELQEKEKSVHQARQEVEQLESVLNGITKELHRLLLQGQHWRQVVQGEKGRLEQFLHFVRVITDRVQRAMEGERIRHLAAELAQTLEDGKPCPVCGSLHHPAPISQVPSLRDWSHTLDRLSKIKGGVEEGLTRLQPLLWQIDQGLQALGQLLNLGEERDPSRKECQPESNALTEAATTLSKDFTSIRLTDHLPFDGGEDVEQVIDQWEEILKLQGERLSRLEGEVHELDRQGQETARRYREMGEVYRRACQALEFYQREYDTLLQKVKEAENLATDSLKAWQMRYPQFDPASHPQLVEQIRERENQVEELNQRYERSITFLKEKDDRIAQLRQQIQEMSIQLAQQKAALDGKVQQMEEAKGRVLRITEGKDPFALTKETEESLRHLIEEEKRAKGAYEERQAAWQEKEKELAKARQAFDEAKERWQKAKEKWEELQRASSFLDEREVKEALLPAETYAQLKETWQEYVDEKKQVEGRIAQLETKLEGKRLDEAEWEELLKNLEEAKHEENLAREARGAALEMLKEIEARHERYVELQKLEEKLITKESQYEHLSHVLRGNAFVEFLAEEQLLTISRAATQRLKDLTRGRYALEVDSAGGFVIRDDANGGVRRPVSSLSGGETFLTSLALALALSSSIQLRGEAPLQFFFLDEGFGTLDEELLDTVITALERLESKQMSIGVISHVPELRARLPRKLLVEPAQPGGRGSRVRIESL